jgi:hypothetical protein
MKKWIVSALVVGAIVAIASAAALDSPATTLTPIDTVPTRPQIDQAFSGSSQTPLQNLTSLATDTQNGNDVGIRLRAIHALAKYCTSIPCNVNDVAHVSLGTVITDNAHETSGSRLLLLRAAIETLGAMRVPEDGGTAGPLLSLLDHPSRDIRTSTARALQEICNSQAITPLRVRYSHELTEQVKLAISEALRILGQCASNP